jgi:DNA-binding NtrC family response regulator
VVEDEETLRKAICESLSMLGYEVLESRDGEEGLAVIESHSGTIDLLLTDAVMPRMSGMDLIQRVHKSHPSIKVVMMSGYATAAISEAGGNSGDVTFLQKPFAHAELAQIVRKLLSKSLPV